MDLNLYIKMFSVLGLTLIVGALACAVIGFNFRLQSNISIWYFGMFHDFIWPGIICLLVRNVLKVIERKIL